MCEAKCGRDWSGDVIVRLNRRIRADFGFIMGKSHVVAEPGSHRGCANSHGAIAVYVEAPGQSRETLGAKPNEIAWWSYEGDSERYVWSATASTETGCGWVLASEELRRLQEVLNRDDGNPCTNNGCVPAAGAPRMAGEQLDLLGGGASSQQRTEG